MPVEDTHASAEQAPVSEDSHEVALATADTKFGEFGIIQTASGEAYNFDEPDPASILLEDIAHALSNGCRFAGHTRRFYSVAEHSVLVSRILEARGKSIKRQREGLLHDSHEAYIWDCPRPLKPLLGDAYKELAAKADMAICIALRVPDPAAFHSKTIKAADDLALVIEAQQLMHTTDEPYWQERARLAGKVPEGLLQQYPWTRGNQYVRGTLGLDPGPAKRAFLARCEELEVTQ